MAIESTALSSHPDAAYASEPPPATDRAARSDRRTPTARETLATLAEPEAETPDFEPHDTIPAPTWLGEPDGEQAPTQKAP
ncbi:MAG: hypothetical protein EOO73_09270 [Myxococcales bacterium]|nr:MAG: hypothetical protein EOO73_09270 [Myxococcales bacterium]